MPTAWTSPPCPATMLRTSLARIRQVRKGTSDTLVLSNRRSRLRSRPNLRRQDLNPRFRVGRNTDFFTNLRCLAMIVAGPQCLLNGSYVKSPKGHGPWRSEDRIIHSINNQAGSSNTIAHKTSLLRSAKPPFRLRTQARRTAANRNYPMGLDQSPAPELLA